MVLFIFLPTILAILFDSEIAQTTSLLSNIAGCWLSSSLPPKHPCKPAKIIDDNWGTLGWTILLDITFLSLESTGSFTPVSSSPTKQLNNSFKKLLRNPQWNHFWSSFRLSWPHENGHGVETRRSTGGWFPPSNRTIPLLVLLRISRRLNFSSRKLRRFHAKTAYEVSCSILSLSL